jgi:hypothetical protein
MTHRVRLCALVAAASTGELGMANGVSSTDFATVKIISVTTYPIIKINF